MLRPSAQEPCGQTYVHTTVQNEDSRDGVAGMGVHCVPDPIPAEQGSSPELSSGSPGSTSISEGPSRESGTPWKELAASIL